MAGHKKPSNPEVPNKSWSLRQLASESRHLDLADARFILSLLSSDGFIRNIGDRGIRDLQQAEKYLTDGPLASYATNGFGYYLVEDHRRIPLGIAGLTRKDWLYHTDLGYALLPSAEGRGPP